MAAYFRDNVILLVFIFGFLTVYSQPNLEEAQNDTDLPKLYESEFEETESMLDSMQMDITAGPTPSVCYPNGTCGFELFDVETWDLLDEFLRNCAECPEGYHCVYDGTTNMRQGFYKYSCLEIPTTTSIPVTEVPGSLSNRRGSFPDEL